MAAEELRELRLQLEQSRSETGRERKIQDIMNDLRLKTTESTENIEQSHSIRQEIQFLSTEDLKKFEHEKNTESAMLGQKIADVNRLEDEIVLDLRVTDPLSRISDFARKPAISQPLDNVASTTGKNFRLHHQLEAMIAEKASVLTKIKQDRENLVRQRDVINSDLERLRNGQGPAILPRWKPVPINKRQTTATKADQSRSEGKEVPKTTDERNEFITKLKENLSGTFGNLRVLKREHDQLLEELKSVHEGSWAAPVDILISHDQKKQQGFQQRQKFIDAVEHLRKGRQSSADTRILQPSTPKPDRLSGKSTTSLVAAQETGFRVVKSHEDDGRQYYEPASDIKVLPAMKRGSIDLQEELEQLRDKLNRNGSYNSEILTVISALEMDVKLLEENMKRKDPAKGAAAMVIAGGVNDQRTPKRNLERTKLDEITAELVKTEEMIQLHQNKHQELQQQVDKRRQSMKLLAASSTLSTSISQPASNSESKGINGDDVMSAEEQEIAKLAKAPRGSELYELRKKHLEEMLKLKFEIERLKQESEKEKLGKEVEIMKKEHERRDWRFQQEQQLLEAKYRKHMARDKKVIALATSFQADEDEDGYVCELGFATYFDFILGLPAKVQDQIQIVYGFFNQSRALNQPKALPLVDIERSHRRAIPAMKRAFVNVPVDPQYFMLIEVQSISLATSEKDSRTTPVGWAVLSLFSKEGFLKRGLWRIPMFHPPVRLEAYLDRAANALGNVQIQDFELFLRLCSAQQVQSHDDFAVNPEMSKVLYKELWIDHSDRQDADRVALTVQAPPFENDSASLFKQSPARKNTLSLSEIPEHPMVEVIFCVRRIYGNLVQHGHCRPGGSLFLRVRISHMDGKETVPLWIRAHPNSKILFPGSLGDAEFTFSKSELDSEMETKESWNTTLKDVNSVGTVTTLEWNQGCTLFNVACMESANLILELVQRIEGTESSDIVVGWVSLPLFKKIERAKDDSDASNLIAPSELVLCNQVHFLKLLAPPVNTVASSNDLFLSQEKRGKELGISGLVGQGKDVQTVLSFPVPILTLEIDPIDRPQVPVKSLKKVVNKLAEIMRWKKTKVPETIWTYTDTEPWIACPETSISTKLFSENDGFDLYIDGCRYLPENASLSRVTAYVASSDMTIIGKLEKEIDSRSMSVACPIYLARKELRGKVGAAWDPTLTIMIEISALERQGMTSSTPMKVAIVGFSALAVFVDPETGLQPTRKDISEVVLHEGSFQLPIFRSALQEGQALTANAFSASSRRLASSVLVRIVKAPKTSDGLSVLSTKGIPPADWRKLGLWIPPKPYKDGKYSNSLPTDAERYIFTSRLELEKQPKRAITALVEVEGVSAAKEDEFTAEDFLEYDYKNFSDKLQNIRNRIRTVMRVEGRTASFSIMDPTYSVRYFPELGFKVSIDGLDNIPDDLHYCWMGSIVSFNGKYYISKGSMTNDIALTHQLDMASDWRCPRWQDGYQYFVPMNKNTFGSMYAVIDVRALVTQIKSKGLFSRKQKLTEPQAHQLGFAFLPILGKRSNDDYVLSGNYQLPLFRTPSKTNKSRKEGFSFGPTDELCASLDGSPTNIYAVLDKALKNGDIEYVPGCSVLLRLLDSLRENELDSPFTVRSRPNATKIELGYLPPGRTSYQAVPPSGDMSVHAAEYIKDGKLDLSIVQKFLSSCSLPPDVMGKRLYIGPHIR